MNEQEFGRMVEAHRGLALRIASRYLASLDDREDVAQEAMRKAYQNRHRFNPALPFEPWFQTIVQNLCFSVLRQRRRRPSEVSLDWLPDLEDETQEIVLAGPLMAEIAHLRPEIRHILVRLYVEGYTAMDVAREMGRTKNSVYSLASYWLKKLHTGVGSSIGSSEEITV